MSYATRLAAAVAVLCLTSLPLPSWANNTFAFFTGANGGLPDGQLIEVNGTFYGTTREGGLYGFGTVFSVTGNQPPVTIYDFHGGTGDGARPESKLIEMGNVLYGTTRMGGAYGDGTVFSVPISGGLDHVLHSFGAPGDGINPVGGLVAVGTNLYGTTAEGGTGTNCSNTTSYPSCGTVYRISICPDAAYAVIYNFRGHTFGDGGVPFSTLTYWHGPNNDWLYGTTTQGGTGGPPNCPTEGCGTVFRLPLTGATDQIRHSFAGGADGRTPYTTGGLIIVGQNLYGTTFYGGNSLGTVFSQPLNGNAPLQVLATFNGNNGEHPAGSVLHWQDPNGNWLYGTAYAGGTGTCSSNYACGFVFRVPLAGGAVQDMLPFHGHPTEGGLPYAGLTYWRDTINAQDWLYGVAEEGGGATCPNGLGCGGIFRLNP